MIVEWFYSIGASLMVWLISQFPAWEVPTWFSTIDQGMTSMIENLDGLSGWIDMGFATGVVMAVIGVWIVCFIIKLVLRVGSHVPGVGGAG